MAWKRDATGMEDSDFPIVCETCLGDNPMVRMTRERYAKECKICERPFTVFRWKAGTGGRYKKTEVCQVCAKLKNVCQVCLLDLTYGLPVQVRDTALSAGDPSTALAPLPHSKVNREFFHAQAEQQLQQVEGGGALVPFGQAGLGPEGAGSAVLHRMRRTQPYYKRNRPHICSFFVKGECNRGDACPFRHEMPETGDLAKQNIKDRYYGINDPVAKKMMARAEQMPRPRPPEDPSITTLYVGGIRDEITQGDISKAFTPHGDIREICILSDRMCAFVTFVTRQGAESAADALYDRLLIKGSRLKVMWRTPLTKAAPAATPMAAPAPASEVAAKADAAPAYAAAAAPAVPLTAGVPLPAYNAAPVAGGYNPGVLPPGAQQVMYPSMGGE